MDSSVTKERVSPWREISSFFICFSFFLNNKTEHLWLHWNLGLCQLSVDGGSTPNWLLKHFFFTMSSMLGFTSRGRCRDIAAVPAHSATIILVPRYCTHMSPEHAPRSTVLGLVTSSSQPSYTDPACCRLCTHNGPYFLCPPGSESLCTECCFLLAQQLWASGGPGNPARRTPFQCILPSVLLFSSPGHFRVLVTIYSYSILT